MKSGGPSIYAILAFVVLLIVVGLVVLVVPLLSPAENARAFGPEVTMPIVIVVTVAVMMALLFAIAAAFSALGLANAQHALGLPEGSIRALIALILIMVFIILDIFMFRIVGQGTEGLIVGDSIGIIDSLSEGTLITNVEPIEGGRVLISVRNPVNADGTRLAQQIVTTVGTLVVAVAGFYFGSSAVSSGVTAAASAAGLATGLGPVILDFTPKSGQQGQTIQMRITGRRLRNCRTVRLVRGDSQVMTNSGDVTSSDAEATCNIFLSGDPSGGKWDLEVENELGQRDTWPQVFELMPRSPNLEVEEAILPTAGQ
jgi:hypothetical protein